MIYIFTVIVKEDLELVEELLVLLEKMNQVPESSKMLILAGASVEGVDLLSLTAARDHLQISMSGLLPS